MSEVNIPLLRKAVEWAEQEAAKPFELCEWYQDDYIVREPKILAGLGKAPECGTCYCIAGYVARQLDARYALSNEVEGVEVEDFAANALGIQSLSEVDDFDLHLFSDINTIEDVRRIAEELAGGRL